MISNSVLCDAAKLQIKKLSHIGNEFNGNLNLMENLKIVTCQIEIKEIFLHCMCCQWSWEKFCSSVQCLFQQFMCVIITCNHLPFKIFSKFVHFCPKFFNNLHFFNIFEPFFEKSHPSYFLEKTLVSIYHKKTVFYKNAFKQKD